MGPAFACYTSASTCSGNSRRRAVLNWQSAFPRHSRRWGVFKQRSVTLPRRKAPALKPNAILRSSPGCSSLSIGQADLSTSTPLCRTRQSAARSKYFKFATPCMESDHERYGAKACAVLDRHGTTHAATAACTTTAAGTDLGSTYSAPAHGSEPGKHSAIDATRAPKLFTYRRSEHRLRAMCRCFGDGTAEKTACSCPATAQASLRCSRLEIDDRGAGRGAGHVGHIVGGQGNAVPPPQGCSSYRHDSGSNSVKLIKPRFCDRSTSARGRDLHCDGRT